MTEEAKFYNALNIAHQADYRKLKSLKEKFGTWQKAFVHDSAATACDPEKESQKLIKHNVDLVLFDEETYPRLLREIHSPPQGLYIKGSLNMDRPTIAIIGTRKSTSHGETIARTWAEKLSSMGALIVSGLALGIDAAAHQGAVNIKCKTVAVLGCGLSEIYPSQNKKLGDDIVRHGGAILSEYPFTYPSLPRNFVERNRIVSGLSLGILVIEAPEKSGALITCSFAIADNREVMVVPGQIGHPNYVGSHALIKDGAILVSSPEEVLQALGLQVEHSAQSSSDVGEKQNSKNKEEKLIIEVLSKAGEPLIIDELAAATNLDSAKISGILTILILQDIIKETHGKYEIRYS